MAADERLALPIWVDAPAFGADDDGRHRRVRRGYALGLPEALSAAVTAIVVTQSNVGGSLRTAAEQIVGSALGAAWTIAVALAIRPTDVFSSAAALAIALAPLSMLTARSPGFRIAPITAAIVLLGTNGLQLCPVDLGAHRILGVGLGCGVGLLVSLLVAPLGPRSTCSKPPSNRRASGRAAAGAGVRRGQLPGCPRSKAREVRENLVRLASFVEEATHERRARLAEVPDGERMLRTLRRLRRDVAVREAGSDALHAHAAAPWQEAAASGASTPRSLGRLLAGRQESENVNNLAGEVPRYRAAVEKMRQAGVTHALSTEDLGRLFGIWSI